jgi:hypothetical protein
MYFNTYYFSANGNFKAVKRKWDQKFKTEIRRKKCGTLYSKLTNSPQFYFGKPVYKSVPFRSHKATLKKMTSPVTSTNVATNGAEDEAGSAPSLFNSNGSMLPISDDQRTTPTNEKQTVNPMRIQ